MISTFTMERPAMPPMAAPVGAALAALPPVEMATGLPGPIGSTRLTGVFAHATGGFSGMANGSGIASSPATYAVDGVKPNVCHEWTRDRQVGITLRSSRHLRSPRT
ncbi:hypothetical protein [Desertimonas flava]|jgi:hypothetical protein|uniref:hypothetical protein n=1 Tax=Desertimonas flava TaxID=2064846 RepID=UPI000E346C1C|nr:hypothetical protein [Desertimonas flava]